MAAVSEERKLVTILFADVIGSTGLSERLDPERLRSLLDTYFAAMSEGIVSWGGTVEKFIGDAIVAVFGVPIAREDDTERALRAGGEMLERLDRLNRLFDERYRVTPNIRIGVNTGEVIAPVGQRVDRGTVYGDAVNVSARLQEAAEPGTVLAGERTYLAARNALRFSEPVRHALKGRAEPVLARRLLGPETESRRGVPGLQAPMVGRDPELGTLVSLLEDVKDSSRPRFVAVLGPAGVGKTRLVHEFVSVVSERYPAARVLRGRCLAAGRGITYWALGEMLRTACVISLDDPAEVAAEKLRSSLQAHEQPAAGRRDRFHHLRARNHGGHRHLGQPARPARTASRRRRDGSSLAAICRGVRGPGPGRFHRRGPALGGRTASGHARAAHCADARAAPGRRHGPP